MHEKQKFLTLSAAAALTPYSSSYLSFLARKGKLRSIKNGDTWFTTREWVLDYMNFIAAHPQINSPKQKTAASAAPVGYITSAQAERIFPYSSSYFSLRIRQGKLKGQKIEGKWYTTEEWINEYIKEYGEKGNPVIASDPLGHTRGELRERSNDRLLRNLFNFSFLQPTTVALSILTILIVAGPPKFMAHWVYEPLAIAYNETLNTIDSLPDKLNLDNTGQVAGASIKSEK